jgi:hypothetical protein
MCLILPKKYAIKFNTKFVPEDFNKWTKLEFDDKNNKKILLNDYKNTIIKSTETKILLNLGGLNFVIKQNCIYFPFFPEYHYFYLTLSPDIDIYIKNNVSAVNFELNKIISRNNSTILNDVILYNLSIIDNETTDFIDSSKYLLVTNGMCGLTIKKYIDVNIEEFYYLYEQEENTEENVEKKEIQNNISLIDKYYQQDAIKICKFI